MYHVFIHFACFSAICNVQFSSQWSCLKNLRQHSSVSPPSRETSQHHRAPLFLSSDVRQARLQTRSASCQENGGILSPRSRLQFPQTACGPPLSHTAPVPSHLRSRSCSALPQAFRTNKKMEEFHEAKGTLFLSEPSEWLLVVVRMCLSDL